MNYFNYWLLFEKEITTGLIIKYVPTYLGFDDLPSLHKYLVENPLDEYLIAKDLPSLKGAYSEAV